MAETCATIHAASLTKHVIQRNAELKNLSRFADIYTFSLLANYCALASDARMQVCMFRLVVSV